MEPPREYSPNYRKPPKDGQYKPGQSGNRRGRPKTPTLSFDELVREELNSIVEIRQNGKTKKIRKLALIVKQAIDQAAKGNFRFLKLLTENNAFRSIMENPEQRPFNSEQQKFLESVYLEAKEANARYKEKQLQAGEPPTDSIRF